MSDLTPKQAAFVRQYLVDLNGSQAAIRAGYSEKTARFIAAENLTKPNIQKAISEGFQVRAERVEITQDYVLGMLVKNVERAMQSEPVLDREGNPTGEYTYHGSVANKALELLGKHLGIFPERHDITIRQEAERLAADMGLPLDEVQAEVERILAART